MINEEESKRLKAKQLRLKKPISKYLNLDAIKQDLYDIQDACEEVRWYTDAEDGTDSLINALLGDDDEAYEFKMAFADLCGQCEQMWSDLQDEWVPDCFDIFFVSTSKDNDEMLGWDSYEQDYMGIGYSDHWLREAAGKKLKTMTKDNLIEASMQCLRIYQAYIGLRNRYDSLKCSIDVLRDKNTGHIQVIKEIERLYEDVSKNADTKAEWSKETKEWNRFTDALPSEAWIA